MSVINWLNKPDFKNGHVCEFIEGPFRKKKGLVVQSGFREGPRSGIMFQRVKVAGFRSLVETPQAHTRILHMVQWKVRETPPPHVIYSYGTGRLRCSQDSCKTPERT